MQENLKIPVKVLAFSLGFTSFIVQMVLLREFLNLFMGNELVIGIVLSLWMLLTATGAFIGKYAVKHKRNEKIILWAILFTAILPVAGAFFSIFIRTSFYIPGVMLGLDHILWVVLAGLTGFCILSGMMYTLLAGSLAKESGRKNISVIYAIESGGSLIGGLAFNFILVYTLASFQILFSLMIINMLVLTWYAHVRKCISWEMIGGSLVILALIISLVYKPDRAALEMLYPGEKIIGSNDTPYGKLVITERDRQINLYNSGSPVSLGSEIIEKEEKVHFALCLHPKPDRVLMLMGGIDGSPNEIRKYGIGQIEYVDPDPWLVNAAKMYAGLTWPAEMKLHIADPRTYLRREKFKYDIILLNSSSPNTIGENRFFTDDFFKQVKQRLYPGGIFSIKLPPSGNYLDKHAIQFLSSIYNTLKTSFKHVRIIPGNSTYFIGSDKWPDGNITSLIDKKGIPTEYVNRNYLNDNHMNSRAQQIQEALDPKAFINTNARPLASYIIILRWLSIFKVSPWLLLLIPFAIMAFIIFRLSPLSLGLFATGFSSSAAEFLLLIAFQLFYGHIYQMAGTIIMAFMAGLAAGSGYLYKYIKNDRRNFFRIQLLLGVFIGLLPLLLIAFSMPFITWLPGLIIGILTFALGVITGLQYRLATILWHAENRIIAASTYSADLAGSAFGLFFAGIFLFSNFGLLYTCLFLTALNFVVAMVVRRKA